MDSRDTFNARKLFAAFALATLFDAIDAGHESKIGSPRIQREFTRAGVGGRILFYGPQIGRAVRTAAVEMQQATSDQPKLMADSSVCFGFLRTIRTQALGELLMELRATDDENPLESFGFEVVVFTKDVKGARFAVRRTDRGTPADEPEIHKHPGLPRYAKRMASPSEVNAEESQP